MYTTEKLEIHKQSEYRSSSTKFHMPAGRDATLHAVSFVCGARVGLKVRGTGDFRKGVNLPASGAMNIQMLKRDLTSYRETLHIFQCQILSLKGDSTLIQPHSSYNT